VFESLKFLEPDKVKERLSSKDKEAVDYLFGMKDLNMQEILFKGHNEWGFGLKTKSRFIQGQIDLWSELDNEIHVIDYKTGSSQYKEKALEQLAYYTCALFEMKQISPHKKIIHSVIYPLEKTVEIREFKNRTDFEANLPSKISEIFQ
jgi:ATP-dependent exoDNAse (exonuclease V) beta subunit